MIHIGNVIKKQRSFLNLTQDELALKLNVSPQAVSRWECGISYPDIAMVPVLTKVLSISADKLLGCEKPETITMDEDTFLAVAKVIDTSSILNQSQIDSIFDAFDTCNEGKQKKVFVIDDSDFMRMMLEDMLTKNGHTVIQAENGALALKVLDSDKPNVCVLDIKMPVMDGLETLEQIKNKYPEIRVIMLSAQSTEENVRKALSLHADGFVAKPFEANTLLERI